MEVLKYLNVALKYSTSVNILSHFPSQLGLHEYNNHATCFYTLKSA